MKKFLILLAALASLVIVAVGAVILLMMIFRPAGLIPATRRETELEGIDEAPRIEPRAVPESESMGATS